MEQKKLLWIIFSVALFLLVVVGAGVIWFFPAPEKEGVAPDGMADSSTEFDPIEWVRQGEEEYPGLQEGEKKPAEDEDFIVVYGESEEEGKKEEAERVEEAPVKKLPKKEPVAKPSEKPAPKKPAAKPEPAPKKVTVTEYWIQVGSYTSQAHSEQVKETLMEKGIASIVTTKAIDDTTYFRVRIGPYSSKKEAEKFLTWIHDINGFSGSYISQVYTKKEVLN
jgi:cell division protein FtsN